MEVPQVFRVNIDFEEQVKYQKNEALKLVWQREWEYLLWWLEDDSKVLEYSRLELYEKSDLDYIQQMSRRNSLFECRPSENTEIINWWGDLGLNHIISKLDLPMIRHSALGDDSSYILRENEVPYKFPCIIKKDLAFSGMGVKEICSREQFLKIYKEQRSEKLLVEQLHNIERHFGYYIFENGDQSFYETFSFNKEYRGCLFYRGYRNSDSFCKFSNKFKRIQNYLAQTFQVTCGYGIDCYIHTSGIQVLCEINHRKTLAAVCSKIFDKYFSDFEYGRSFIFRAPKLDIVNIKEKMRLVEKELKVENRYRVLRLSPLSGQYFFHFFIAGHDLSGIELGRQLLQNSFNLP